MKKTATTTRPAAAAVVVVWTAWTTTTTTTTITTTATTTTTKSTSKLVPTRGTRRTRRWLFFFTVIFFIVTVCYYYAILYCCINYNRPVQLSSSAVEWFASRSLGKWANLFSFLIMNSIPFKFYFLKTINRYTSVKSNGIVFGTLKVAYLVQCEISATI